METWIDNQIVYKGKIVSLRTGTARLDNGDTAKREVVEHPGGVAIVPVLDGSVLLVRQFRIAVGRELAELPAGKLEPGETPEACAGRELEEEISYRPGQLIPVAKYYSSVGFTNEQMHIFLGLDLQKADGVLESDERIEIIPVPISEIESKLMKNGFEDSKTIIGLYALLAYLRNKPHS